MWRYRGRALGLAASLFAAIAAACSFGLPEPALVEVAPGDGGPTADDASAAPEASDALVDAPDGGVSPEADAEPGDARLARVSSGLLALFPFDEDGGTTVHDLAGIAPALDLMLPPNKVGALWVPGGLSFTAGIFARTAGNAARVLQACTASGEITLEAWAESNPLPQGQPGLTARIVQIGQDNTQEEVALGIIGLDYRFRLNQSSGTQTVAGTGGGAATQALTHIVGTRASTGGATLYLNGAVVGTAAGVGPLWPAGNNDPLSVANTAIGDRPWTGTLYLVAIYGRALTAADVAQNFAAGP